MHLMRNTLPLFLAGWFVFPAMLLAADPPSPSAGKVSYFRDVRPILQANCQGCHQPAKAGGEYVMTAFDRLVKGGESNEPAVVAGKPEASRLVKSITAKDGKTEMPKGKPPLAEADSALIKRWISEGAADDTPPSAAERFDLKHPPVYVQAPVITAVRYSPDGQYLAVSGYHEVLLHKADGSQLVARLVGLSERVQSLAFSPDSKFLAVAGGSPGRMGEVQIWDVAKRELKLSYPVTYDTLYGAAWSPDGKQVSFGGADKTMRSIDVEKGQQVLFNQAHDDWVLDTVWGVDGKHVVSVSRDRSVKLVELETQRFIDNITSITPGALKGGLQAVDRHPTKQEILIGGADGTPKIYKMFRDKARQIGDDFNLIRACPPMPGRLFSVRYSRDGTKLAACSSNAGNGQIAMFTEADGKQLWKLDVAEGGIYAVDISPDGGTVAAGGFDGPVRLINAADGKVRTQFLPVTVSPAVAGAAK